MYIGTYNEEYKCFFIFLNIFAIGFLNKLLPTLVSCINNKLRKSKLEYYHSREMKEMCIMNFK